MCMVRDSESVFTVGQHYVTVQWDSIEPVQPIHNDPEAKWFSGCHVKTLKLIVYCLDYSTDCNKWFLSYARHKRAHTHINTHTHTHTH